MINISEANYFKMMSRQGSSFDKEVNEEFEGPRAVIEEMKNNGIEECDIYSRLNETDIIRAKKYMDDTSGLLVYDVFLKGNQTERYIIDEQAGGSDAFVKAVSALGKNQDVATSLENNIKSPDDAYAYANVLRKKGKPVPENIVNKIKRNPKLYSSYFSIQKEEAESPVEKKKSAKDKVIEEIAEVIDKILESHYVKGAEEIFEVLNSYSSEQTCSITLEDVKKAWNLVMESNPRTRASHEYRSLYPDSHFLAHSTDTMHYSDKKDSSSKNKGKSKSKK